MSTVVEYWRTDIFYFEWFSYTEVKKLKNLLNRLEDNLRKY